MFARNMWLGQIESFWPLAPLWEALQQTNTLLLP